MAGVAELIVRVVADTSRARGELDKTADSANKWSSGLKSAAVPAAAALLAVGAAAVKAGNAAAEDAQSQAVLATAMEKNTGASKASIASMEDYIAKMSAATGVADDELRPAMGNLLRATGDAAKSQEAMAVAMDVSAATGKSLESVSGAMAKGFGGSTTSLGKLVPGMDAAVLAGGDMSAIMDELADKTGGSAAAAADTAAGKMKIMQTSMAEAEESIGTALLPAMAKLADILATVANAAAAHPGLFQAVAAAVVALASAILIANGVMKVITISTQLFGATATKAWIATLGPIALVIAAIALVALAVVLLWKRSETFRTIVMAVWNAVRNGATAAAAAIKTAFVATWNAIEATARGLGEAVRAVWTAIRNTASAVAGALREVFSNAWGAIREGAGNVRDAVSNAFRAVRETVGIIAGAVRESWGNAIAAIKGAMAGLGAVLSGPFDAMKRALDAVVGAVQNLIDWLGRIKIPKISLPHIPGTGRSAPAPAMVTATSSRAPRVPGALAGRATSSTTGPTFVINGAIDPEATARQIRRILAGHDRRVGLA